MRSRYVRLEGYEMPLIMGLPKLFPHFAHQRRQDLKLPPKGQRSSFPERGVRSDRIAFRSYTRELYYPTPKEYSMENKGRLSPGPSTARIGVLG